MSHEIPRERTPHDRGGRRPEEILSLPQAPPKAPCDALPTFQASCAICGRLHRPLEPLAFHPLCPTCRRQGTRRLLRVKSWDAFAEQRR